MPHDNEPGIVLHRSRMRWGARRNYMIVLTMVTPLCNLAGECVCADGSHFLGGHLRQFESCAQLVCVRLDLRDCRSQSQRSSKWVRFQTHRGPNC